jgi:hypothetical protein
MEIANLNKLKIGQTYNNYKELCTVLQVSEVGGNAKKSFLAKLARQVVYKQEGRKFTVLEILPMPKPKPARADAIYIEELTLGTLEYLAKYAPENDGTNVKIFVEKYKLALYVGLCNELFYYKRSEHNAQHILCRQQNEKDFFDTITKKINSVLESMFKGLKTRHLISVEPSWQYDTGDNKDIITIKSNETIVKDIQYKYMKSMGFPSLFAIALSEKKKEFDRKVNQDLKEQYDITNLRSGYCFTLSNKVWDRIANITLELAESGHKYNTNKKILEFMQGKALQYVNTLTIFGEYDFKEKKFVSVEEVKEKHLLDYERLINECIKIYEE